MDVYINILNLFVIIVLVWQNLSTCLKMFFDNFIAQLIEVLIS